LKPESLAHSLRILESVVAIVEGDTVYRSLNAKCEPQLGRRGLYSAMGGQSSAANDQMALLWVMNLADGEHSLLDMAERSALPFAAIRAAADSLLRVGLIDATE
jgi:aminopeptidase-like protein